VGAHQVAKITVDEMHGTRSGIYKKLKILYQRVATPKTSISMPGKRLFPSATTDGFVEASIGQTWAKK
jgi:hypothetical protein